MWQISDILHIFKKLAKLILASFNIILILPLLALLSAVFTQLGDTLTTLAINQSE